MGLLKLDGWWLLVTTLCLGMAIAGTLMKLLT